MSHKRRLQNPNELTVIGAIFLLAGGDTNKYFHLLVTLLKSESNFKTWAVLKKLDDRGMYEQRIEDFFKSECRENPRVFVSKVMRF